MYSDMSIRTMLFSFSKRYSASARAISVFPTPVGPRKKKLPIGRFGSFKPERERRTARDVAVTASCWPITRLCKSSSIRKSFWLSVWTNRETGIPVQLSTMCAISFSPTSGSALFSAFQASSRVLMSASKASISAFKGVIRSSRSWWRSRYSISRFFLSSCCLSCRTSKGGRLCCRRTRLAASSIKSIALSGSERSLI